MERGIATLELLIALGILTLVLSGIVIISFGNQVIALDTDVRTDALSFTHNVLNIAATRVASGITPSATTSGIFSATIQTTPLSECITSVVVTTTWWEDGLRAQSLSLDTASVHDEVFEALANDCDTQHLSKDHWTAPNVTEFFVADELRDIDIVRRDGTVYAVIAAENETEAVSDLYIVDVASSTAPEPRGSLDVIDPYPVTRVDIGGDYGFLGIASGTVQLIVIDAQNITFPTPLSYIQLPGVDEEGSQPGVESIHYNDGRLYVGTKRTDGPEFHMFDVDVDLNNDEPLHLDSLELNHNALEIAVRDEYAYVASSDNTGELMVFDINDIEHPDVTNLKFDAGGENDGSDGTSIFVGYDKTFLGRKRSEEDVDFLILESSDIENITEIGRGELGLSSGDDYISAIAARGDVLAMAINNDDAVGNYESIEVWDVSDPADPEYINTIESDGDIIDMEIFENVIYALQDDPDMLLIITPGI